MRLPRPLESDGSRVVCLCSRCDGEVYAGEGAYRIGGETVCRYCLPEFARAYFAPCLTDVGEGFW